MKATKSSLPREDGEPSMTKGLLAHALTPFKASAIHILVKSSFAH